ncbi:hypothetical protein [Shewanella colwelliana]|uniref:hypothetical protein n=1 Tax=Shewanella colwelliana TaxID=23 RepID=UPI00299DA5E4|nr:hypothetical protein [Shewanella colwelliana]MDX1280099.1 hypothetical protein [Shewanella colwelliana]
MRRSVKYRVLFLVSAILAYTIGFQILPEQLSGDRSYLIVTGVSVVYFLLLPLLYWYAIIKVGEQKLWKLLIIFSLSSLMARLGFPAEIANYFEFIAWLRFPIIAVLLAIELYLIVSITRGLWQARKAKGDPRLTVINQYGVDHEQTSPAADKPQLQDDKKLTLGYMLATEPASWYYAISYFSRHHASAIAHISSFSASRWHLLLLLSALMTAATGSYLALVNWSELTALFVAGFIAYGVVLLCASHRIARHYSCYLIDEKLVLNRGIWGMLVVKLTSITVVDLLDDNATRDKQALSLGRGQSNTRLMFNAPQLYHGSMGQLTEWVSQVDVVLDNPAQFKTIIEAALAEEETGLQQAS